MQFVEQEELAKSQGILYPGLGREYLHGHHNLARFFTKQRPLINTTRPELSANLSEFLRKEHNKVLLSSEEFVNLSEAGLTELRRCFEAYDIHVLFFRRTGNDLIVSLWQEKVKHGLTTPLDEFVPELIPNNKAFSFEENIAKLKAGLSDPVITVFDYNTLRSQGPNRVMEEICHVLGIELRPSSQMINTCLPIELIELVRAGNLYAESIGSPTTAHAYRITTLLNNQFGGVLRTYASKKVSKLAKCLNSKHFVKAGFPDDQNCRQDWQYVPGSLLFDELNRDKNRLWNSLKQQLNAELSSLPHLKTKMHERSR